MTFKVYCQQCGEIVDDYCFLHPTDNYGNLIESLDEPDERASVPNEEAEEPPASYPEANA